jgi:prepilin-type N-terminal cleavage/methylation domain-containing protein/prepilin-type processing-associated H-X9-DG protein
MSARRGFTLIEVLVTTGIIGTLVALSVGGLRVASERSRATSCRSNLRQIFIASQAYANCHQGHMPAAVLYYRSGGAMRTVAWDFEQHAGKVKPGAIWKFGDGPDRTDAVQQCPDCRVPSTFGADPATGYQYNTTYLGAEGMLPMTTGSGVVLEGWRRVRPGIGPGQWRRTETTAVFADGGWRGGANKFMRAPSAKVENDLGMVYAGGSAFRHRGQCNVAWLDGHVSLLEDPQQGPHASPALLKSPLDWPRNGFLSHDDSAYDPR